MNKLYGFLILSVFFTLSLKAQSDAFYFIQLSDPQLGMLDKNKSFSAETKIMEQAVAKINKLNPAFIVVTGDLVNDGKDQKQIEEFKRICGLIKKNIPVYVIPGNHDLNQQATDESLDNYKNEYGYDCFSFQFKNCCFIGLNMPIIFAGREEKEKAQWFWLEKELENSQKCTHRILFGHYPFFIKEASETDKYQNIPLKKRQAYLDLMEKYQVRNMFAGHLHHNAESMYKDFKITVTNALCMPLDKDRIGFRIIKVYPDKIISEYYELDRIPSKIVL